MNICLVNEHFRISDTCSKKYVVGQKNRNDILPLDGMSYNGLYYKNVVLIGVPRQQNDHTVLDSSHI